MNLKTHNEIVELFLSDCEIAASYIDCDGRTCAIGRLAKAAGVPENVLQKAASASISCAYESTFEGDVFAEERPHVKQIANAITAKFGISHDAMCAIQWANDSERRFIQTRREKVIERFNMFYPYEKLE